MKIEVSLSPVLYPYRTLTHHTTVAIDVLRATTAICAAFQAGCDVVVPLKELEQLPRYRALGYRLAAERNGAKVGDADFGNSPTEYLAHNLKGSRLAYSTTNGTVAILIGADADQLYCGSFANLNALCQRLSQEQHDIVLLCSGWKNDFSLEDTLLAGAIIQQLTPLGGEAMGDAATMALTMWNLAKDNPFAYCQQATHVHRLQQFGAEKDIQFAFQIDTCPIVPTLHDGKLTL